jgi:hypothetical protein
MKTSFKLRSLAAAGAFGLATSLALMSAPASAAYLIGATDVGNLDTVVGAVDSANSGGATEEALLETACGCSVTLLGNVEIFTEVTVGADHYIDVNPSTPEYYVLKFGTGNTGNDMFFMLNEEFLRYLAWSDADLIANGLPANHVQSLSHYAITTSGGGGGGGGGPEPATLALVGLALAAAGVAGKRKQSRG